MKVVPVEHKSAAEHVRSQLIELIESRHFAVDDRLPSEADLAHSFGVSRSVIREALHSLNALGLTKSYAGKGTFVAATRAQSQLLIGRYLPAQLNEVRRYLEVPAARLAAERRTQEDIDGLAALVEEFDKSDDPADRIKIDALFHIAIASATGNPLFSRLVEDLRAVLQDQALAVSASPGRAAQARAEHRAIFEAIRDGDAEMADLAMRRHLAAVVATSTSLTDG
ncbi:FadR/GntR family transcriptional regulator [Acrocarpospora macrocephala]|uniref:GntR family transcriptional regulator n=1 Tax=Acrocarpospora macrocephala TaxID=150177 RepID=A0A5M3X783_9ACTN|nr:FadR/GntR family transcriptional regulator [Acrocarpospora macrocephala]GES16536.1 GntR family transcriptional regulator [Acrocarpospora macrocephala]